MEFHTPYYRETPPQKPHNNSLLWGVCMTVLIAALGASGTLLWKGSKKADTELQQAVYQAVMQERSRVSECIQTPVRKEAPRIQTTELDGNSKFP